MMDMPFDLGINMPPMKSKKNPILLAFGATIRKLRAKKNLSQRALAERSGLDTSYISGIERGVRNASLKSLEKIAKGLGCSIAETFKDLDSLDLKKCLPKKAKRKKP